LQHSVVLESSARLVGEVAQHKVENLELRVSCATFLGWSAFYAGGCLCLCPWLTGNVVSVFKVGRQEDSGVKKEVQDIIYEIEREARQEIAGYSSIFLVLFVCSTQSSWVVLKHCLLVVVSLRRLREENSRLAAELAAGTERIRAQAQQGEAERTESMARMMQENSRLRERLQLMEQERTHLAVGGSDPGGGVPLQVTLFDPLSG
jgi:hypothetical protein